MTQTNPEILSVQIFPFLREVAQEIEARIGETGYLTGVDAEPDRDEEERLTVVGLRCVLAAMSLYAGEPGARLRAHTPPPPEPLTPTAVAGALFAIVERTVYPEVRVASNEWRRNAVLKTGFRNAYKVFLSQLLQARCHQRVNRVEARAKTGEDGKPIGYIFHLHGSDIFNATIAWKRSLLAFGDPQKLVLATMAIMSVPTARCCEAAIALQWLASVPEELSRDDFAGITTFVSDAFV